MAITGCGDPPLLSTPLPNDYSFRSNGGDFGYVADPGGHRMTAYFGIIGDGKERWCGAFGWEGDFVVCEYIEYRGGSLEAKVEGYFYLNSKTKEVTHFQSREGVEDYWRANTSRPFPRLARKHSGTMSR